MTHWQNFLQQHGAIFNEKKNAVLSFSGAANSGNPIASKASTDKPSETGKAATHVIPLTHLGAIEVTGDRSAEFLQGQTTCDFLQLSHELNLTGAQCSPKGRMLNNFTAWKTDSNILLTMSADLIEHTLKDLAKFAPFFKAQIKNASDDYLQLGVIGVDAFETLKACFSTIPQSTHSVVNHQGVYLSKINDRTWHLLVPSGEIETTWSKLTQHAVPTGTSHWHQEMIHSGLGLVEENTREMFIPQMLNLQAVNAISFKKGCYTGQEVVARMKYLGKLKRTMYRLNIKTTIVPDAGTVCKVVESGQGVGNIVCAVRTPTDSVDALAVLTADAASAEQLFIGEQPAASFELEELPYSLETD